MPTASLTKSYSDGNDLTESQLDDLKTSIEAFLNTTKLDADNLQDSAVTTAKINNTAVTTAKIASGAVTNAKLADTAVTNAKITDTTIAKGKLATAVQYALMPTGTILAYGAATAPSGYLVCNGSAVSRTTYADLFAIISTNYGEGDGSTTFHLPDFRGKFLRGYDNGAGNDPDAASRTAANTGGNTGDAVGSAQADQYAEHSHTVDAEYEAANAARAVNGGGGAVGGTYSTNNSGGNETRPINVTVQYIIKT